MTSPEVSIIFNKKGSVQIFIFLVNCNKNDNFVPMDSFYSTSVLGKITFKLDGTKISLMRTFNKYKGGWFDNWYKYSPDSRSTNFS